MKKLVLVIACLTTAIGVAQPLAADAVTGSCPQYEYLLERHNPGWDVARMSRYMFRESRCVPTAWNRRGRAAGLLQITPVNYKFLSQHIQDIPINRGTLSNAEVNVMAAAHLFNYWKGTRAGGYAPWRL